MRLSALESLPTNDGDDICTLANCIAGRVDVTRRNIIDCSSPDAVDELGISGFRSEAAMMPRLADGEVQLLRVVICM
jgi:hypothetical protein